MALTRPLILVALLSFAAPSAAGDWPQGRHDAALTGRTDEPALPSARIRWVAATGGGELSGEPVVAGCSVFVTDAAGTVHALNARSGEPLWTYERDYAVRPEGVGSHLAVLGDALLAGLPVDPLLQRSLAALQVIRTALESFAIDNNDYPPGPELAGALTPTYCRSLPTNPVTGAIIEGSATPSPGDYLYERDPGGGDYAIGIWGSDGGILDLGSGCGGGSGYPPSWPISAERGGSPAELDLATGAERALDLGPGLASVTVPSVGAAGADWWTIESWMAAIPGWGLWWWGAWDPARSERWVGASLRHGPAGARDWSRRAWGAGRGAAAHDAAGNAYTSSGPAALSQVVEGLIRTLAAGAESYSIDYNAYPPSGDLSAALVPTYLRCMPASLRDGALLIEGPPGSGSDYQYASPDGTTYVIRMFDADGLLLAEFDTGSFTIAAEDQPPQVASHAPDGTLRWRRDVGLPTHDVSPPALAEDGSVVVASSGGELLWLDPSDGSERGRLDAGEPVSLAPAILPGGGVVVVTAGGTVIAHRPDRSEAWRRWTGATVTAAPAVTADGLVYVADLDGMLTALRPVDGSVAWRSFLGGPFRAGLTTTPVQSGGWIYVGRSDGTLLAVVPRETAGRLPTPVPLLATGERSTTTAGFTWEGVPEPDVSGSHWHLLRWRGDLTAPPDEILAPHPSAARRHLDTDAGGDLLFYSVVSVDCAENESF